MLITIQSLQDFNMKISELIKILEDYKKTYGDNQIFADAGYNNIAVKMHIDDAGAVK